jgi:hypothetical protein
MKGIFSIFFVVIFSFAFSQVKDTTVKVNVTIDPLFENISVELKTDADSLKHFKIQIVDPHKNVVTTLNIPNSAKQVDVKMNIVNLIPGNYRCEVYKKEEVIYSGNFFKDAVYIEGAGPPVIKPDKKE